MASGGRAGPWRLSDPPTEEELERERRELLEPALPKVRERGEGSDLGNLGIAYARLGEVEKAIGYHEQALVISREIGARRGEGEDLGNLGLAYADLGEVEKAIGLLEQALRIGQEIKDPQIVRIVSAQLEKLRGSSAS